MKKTLSRGFTLIELLVVIAIIGILASVVLASLNSARGKGTNAAIQASVNTVRAQAEIFGQQTNGTVDYTGLCSDAKVAQISNDISAKNGGTSPSCYADTDEWAYEAQLVDSAGYICVDYNGISTTSAASTITTTNGSVGC